MSYFYESQGISIAWEPEGIASIDLSKGWAEDTFLTITPLGARVETTPGADGKFCFSKMANKGATITMTFQQTSDTCRQLAKAASVQDVIGATLPYAPFTVTDSTGNSASFLAFNAVLTELPEVSFAAKSGERTFTWVCETYIMTDDPSTVISTLSSYTG